MISGTIRCYVLPELDKRRRPPARRREKPRVKPVYADELFAYLREHPEGVSFDDLIRVSGKRKCDVTDILQPLIGWGPLVYEDRVRGRVRYFVDEGMK